MENVSAWSIDILYRTDVSCIRLDTTLPLYWPSNSYLVRYPKLIEPVFDKTPLPTATYSDAFGKQSPVCGEAAPARAAPEFGPGFPVERLLHIVQCQSGNQCSANSPLHHGAKGLKFVANERKPGRYTVLLELIFDMIRRVRVIDEDADPVQICDTDTFSDYQRVLGRNQHEILFMDQRCPGVVML